MLNRLWQIYNECLDLPSSQIDQLIDELQILSDRNFEIEQAAKEKADSQSAWENAASNINTFLTRK